MWSRDHMEQLMKNMPKSLAAQLPTSRTHKPKLKLVFYASKDWARKRKKKCRKLIQQVFWFTSYLWPFRYLSFFTLIFVGRLETRKKKQKQDILVLVSFVLCSLLVSRQCSWFWLHLHNCSLYFPSEIQFLFSLKLRNTMLLVIAKVQTASWIVFIIHDYLFTSQLSCTVKPEGFQEKKDCKFQKLNKIMHALSFIRVHLISFKFKKLPETVLDLITCVFQICVPWAAQ